MDPSKMTGQPGWLLLSVIVSIANIKESMNLVFANQNKEDSIYPLTTREIVKAQQQNNYLKEQAEKEDFST